MNTRKLNKTLGFYLPSFFRLHIGTKNSIQDFNKLSDLDFSIFLHEYIHFIQDLTTYYGLNNIHSTAEYLRYANNYIVNQQNQEVDVPIKPNPNNKDLVLLNGEICRITYGDSREVLKIKKIVSYLPSNLTIDIPNNPIPELEVIDVEYIDSNGESDYFSFGASCIMESMAYLFEKLTCKKYSTSPDIPYNTAELIIEYIFPEFGKNKLNVLALCDISLNLSNPGKYFVQTVEYWKNKKSIPKQPEILYDNFYNNSLSVNEKGIIDFKTQFLNLSNTAKFQLKGYFNDPYFDNIKEWIDKEINIAVDYRLNYPTFILDLTKGDIRSNSKFLEFFNRLGTPLLTNDNNEFRFYHPLAYSKQIDIGYFWAISQIQDFLFGNKGPCSLISFCNQRESETKTDLRCQNEPWSRSNDQKSCPFSLIWRHWKLMNYKPVFKD